MRPPGRQGAPSASSAVSQRLTLGVRMLRAHRGHPRRWLPTCAVSPELQDVEMGARVSRAFRNFNLENRAEREISKMKPSTAPKHPSTRGLLQEQLSQHPEIKEEVSRKDNKLLSLLKDVYVDSKDPVSSLPVKDAEVRRQEPKEFRLPIGQQLDKNVMDIPKGKVSVVEALTLLNNHKLSPETWTAEKIAQEYHLELKDVNSLLKYFVTFEVKIFPPEDRKAIPSK